VSEPRYGYTSISVKKDAQADLTKWQLLVQHKLGRRVNASDALRMAIATAQARVDLADADFPGAHAIVDPTKESA
jgi:hypothetical protein